MKKKMKITLDELKRSNEELERFAYVSSHDLQEPLRMVTLYSQLLERRYKDRLDSDANDFIEYIVENAKRMKQLIDDLLEYSRLTNRAKEFENTDLEKVLENVLSNLSILIVENNVTVTHDSLPTVLADENQMMQVFQNLITNAIKFRGVEPPKIDISAKKNEKEWIFAITDNGIGINPEHQKQIFEVFKRLHTQEEYPGTGIGLSIVQKIILHHHGRIWAESEPGKGSTFYFTIPTINNSGQHTFIIS
jgi:light-regulated signal transduction histidine kinase (bacteriophytochrome)